MNPPSPVTATTFRSGNNILAASAPGTAMPMAANPLDMRHVLGRSAEYMRATHTLCAPTSLMTRSSGSKARRRSERIRWGFRGKASSPAKWAISARRAACSSGP